MTITVLDKQKDYMRPLGDEPIPTMFQMWLDNTYGKTRLGQFWEYMSTIDGIQTLLDLGGFFWDGFDAINCVIYLIRGKYEDAAWSALGVIPFCGSLLSKGAKKAASALSGTLPKAVRLLDEGGAIVKALGLTIEVSPQMLGKFEKLMKGFEDAAQYAASLKGKVRFYFEGVDGIEDLNIFVKLQDEAGDGVHYAFKYGDDVAEGFSDTARVADDVIEGSSDALKNSLNPSTTIDYSYKFDRELVNFNDGYEIKTILDEDLILVQYSSDAPDASLCYWTTVDEANRIMTLDDYMDRLALSKDWGNRNTIKVARIPAGTEVKYAVGSAKEQLLIADPRPGGGIQYLFSQFDTNWITEIRTFPE